MARVAVIQLWQEVNTYSPRRTDLDDFRALELLEGEGVEARHRGARSVVGGFLEEAEYEPVPLFAASAWPAGPAQAETIERLLACVDRALTDSGPLDGALLSLHGAMVAHTVEDVELAVARLVRRRLGDAPIGCVLDLHAIPSPQFIATCDAVIAFDTYPHVDMWQRGREMAGLMSRMIAGQRYASTILKLPVLTSPLAQSTDAEPMRGLRRRAGALAAATPDAKVSLIPGFPYSDVARAGFSIVATAPQEHVGALQPSIARLADEVVARREEFALHRPNPSEAVERALASDRRPVVLVDVADNIGGGAPGDGTALLELLLAWSGSDAVVTIADAEVARDAHHLGSGATLAAEVGGKTDRRHGAPVPIRGRVIKTTDGAYESRGASQAGLTFSMGPTALIEVDGLKLVVTERPTPPFHAEQLTSLGVELERARVITAKGAVAWRTAFGAIADEVIEVDTPGVTPLDPAALPRANPPMAHGLARGPGWA